MKNLILKSRMALVLLTMGLSTAAIAGHPAEDPVVAAIRTQFSEAHLPSTSELRLGSAWSCRFFESVRGTSSQPEGPVDAFQFANYGVSGLLMNQIEGSTVQLVAFSVPVESSRTV